MNYYISLDVDGLQLEQEECLQSPQVVVLQRFHETNVDYKKNDQMI